MKVLITGICGFVGSTLAAFLREARDASALEIAGIDNLSRAGSETNRELLRSMGVRLLHGDVRLASDVAAAGAADWVVDAAANPSVLAGVDGRTSSRQLVEHNLTGTLNLLEHCRTHGAGFLLLSTSRVYAIDALQKITLESVDGAFRPAEHTPQPHGLTAGGVAEQFPARPPVSLYGATKIASEVMALEYHHSLGVPVWIDRCGVLAGAGQFGHPAQGIFAYWVHAHRGRQPLTYIGYDGTGYQTRDCLHPRDLGRLVLRQLEHTAAFDGDRVINVSGGMANAMSLAQLTQWCDQRFGPHEVAIDAAPRRFDVPWLVLDSTRARELWSWQPEIGIDAILDEIAGHAERHPHWLQLSGAMP